MKLAPRFASIALTGVAVFALFAATPATAAPLAVPASTNTEKCGKPQVNADGSLGNVLCPNGKANSQVKKYLTKALPNVMALGKNPSRADVGNAACMDIDKNDIPIIVDGYAYVHAANNYKKPTPSVDALVNALLKREDDNAQADAVASGFVFGMC
jgi:hypothetical protein